MARVGNESKVTGTNKCVDHPTEVYQRYCKTCDILVCIECVLDKHKSHRCVKLIEILDLKRNEIKEHLKDLKRKEVTDLKSKLSSIKQRRDNYSGECLSLKTCILQHAENLKSEIDNVRDDFIRRMEKKRKTDEMFLGDLETNLERELLELESFIQDLSVKINNLQGVEVLTCVEDCKKSLMRFDQTDDHVVNPPTFIYTGVNPETIRKIFGDLKFQVSEEESSGKTKCTVISGVRKSGNGYTGSSEGVVPQITTVSKNRVEQIHGELAEPLMTPSFDMDHELGSDFDVSLDRNIPNQSAEKETPLCTRRIAIKRPTKKLASLVSKMNSPIKPIFLSVTKYRELWIGNCEGDLLKLKLGSMGRNTTLLKTKLNFAVNSIAVNKAGNLLISSPTDKKIVVLTEQQQVEDFIDTGPFIPEGICVAQNGDVFVALHQSEFSCSKSVGKIHRYSSRGILIFSSQYDSNDKELFSYPFIVAENANGDIWVIDLQASKLIVLNGKGQFRFFYSGNAMGTNWAPRGVVSNNKGQVLIADNENDVVHLVDPDGQFLEFVLTRKDGLCKPYSVTMDTDGRFYLGNVGNSTIQVFDCD